MSYTYDNETTNQYLNIFSEAHNKYPDFIKMIKEGGLILDLITRLKTPNETIIEEAIEDPPDQSVETELIGGVAESKGDSDETNESVETVISVETTEPIVTTELDTPSESIETTEPNVPTESTETVTSIQPSSESKETELLDLKRKLRTFESKFKQVKNLDKIKSVLDDDALNRAERYYQKQFYNLKSDYNKFVAAMHENRELANLNWKKYPYNEVLNNSPSYKHLLDRLSSVRLAKQLYQIEKEMIF
jgi:hypothetical protein